MKLAPVSPVNTEHVRMLHVFMVARALEPNINISHRSVPSLRRHKGFVQSRPYRQWWMVMHRKECVGTAYLTKQREIGLYLLPAFRSAGIGSKVVAEVRRRFPGPILANVNPENVKARQFWERMGGKLLQVTYAI